jgi:hypothetical protein
MMRADELMVLSVAEYNELKARAERSSPGELFNAEEMQAIREQYVERVEAAEGRREELEWKLRVELAKIRDAELSSRRAADEMRRIELTLQALLCEDDDDTHVRSPGPRASLQPVAPKPQAKVTLSGAPRPVPPPLPPVEGGDGHGNGNGNGSGNGTSQAEKFKLAMANRKRFSA